jgi:hypothetical protein
VPSPAHAATARKSRDASVAHGRLVTVAQCHVHTRRSAGLENRSRVTSLVTTMPLVGSNVIVDEIGSPSIVSCLTAQRADVPAV